MRVSPKNKTKKKQTFVHDVASKWKKQRHFLALKEKEEHDTCNYVRHNHKFMLDS